MYMGPPTPPRTKVGTRYRAGSEDAERVGEDGEHAGGAATVDDERVAGDERRVVGREEQHRRRDLVRLPEAPELVGLPVLVLEVAEAGPVDHRGEHRGAFDEAGTHAVHPDPGAAVVRSEEHTSELQSLRHLVCR